MGRKFEFILCSLMLILLLDSGVTMASHPIGISLMDKLRYGYIDTVALVEVIPGSLGNNSLVHKALAEFKVLETWRGKPLPATIKANLCSGHCSFDRAELQAFNTPGNRFVIFASSTQGTNPVIAQVYAQANPENVARIKRCLWKTENAVGKTLDDVLKDAAAKGNMEAKQELAIMGKPSFADTIREKYPEDLDITVPSHLRGIGQPEIFIQKKVADLDEQLIRHPSERTLLKARAEWLMAAKRFHEAIADYNALLKFGEKVQRDRAQAYLQNRNFGDAIRDFSEVIPADDKEHKIQDLTDRARAYYCLKEYSKALVDIKQSRLLDKCGEQFPSVDSYAREFLAACIEFKLGKYADCSRKMAKLIEAEWGNGDAFAWKALSDVKQKKVADFNKDCKGMLLHASTLGLDEQSYLLGRDIDTQSFFAQQEEAAFVPIVQVIRKLASSFDLQNVNRLQKEFDSANVAGRVNQYGSNGENEKYAAVSFPFKVDSRKMLRMLAELKPVAHGNVNGDRQRYICKLSWGILSLNVWKRPDGIQTVESIGFHRCQPGG